MRLQAWRVAVAGSNDKVEVIGRYIAELTSCVPEQKAAVTVKVDEAWSGVET